MIGDKFEIRGVHPRLTLQEQLETSRRNAERFNSVGDEIVAVVDVLANADPAKNPETMTVQEHVHAAEDKLQRYLRDKDLEELIEIGAFIGPFVTAVANSPTEYCDEFVRLGLYQPRIRY